MGTARYVGIALSILGLGAEPTGCFFAAVGPRMGSIIQGDKSASTSPGRSLKELKGDLSSPYGDKRRRTVAKLAALGGQRAFDLVVETLDDKEPEAADEAQLQLPAFESSMGTERVQRELLGRRGLRSPDPMVQRRVAEAFGRMTGPVDGKALLGRLQHRDVEVAGALLWSVERLSAAGRLGLEEGEGPGKLSGSLDRLFRPGVADSVRARAIAALVQLDPVGFAARRERLAKLRGVETTCAFLAAEVAAAATTGATEVPRRAICRALADEEPAVRAMAIRLFPSMEPLAEDLVCLAERLEGEPRPALRAQIVATLQGLTGWKHRERVEAWTHSLSTLGQDWRAPSGEALGDPLGGGDSASVASLERLPPMSDRVAFLVDFSGSLWNEREDGSCRKDLLDPEMDRLLDQLDPGTRFALIPFTGKAHPFQDSGVVATARELTRAKRFFKKAKMRGQGNLYGAIQVALQDGEFDRLIILTDGAPTGGVRWNVDLMGDLLVEETRFRPVIFDFVLLDAPVGLQRTWASVARRTGGRTLALRM